MKVIIGSLILVFSLSVFAGSAEKAENIPGLKLLTSTISRMPIDQPIKKQLLELVVPSKIRTYHWDAESRVEEERRKELVQTYAQIFHVPPEEIILFGVTIGRYKTTFLYPAFYELKSEEAQAAALLHESLWILNSPEITYNRMVEIERSAVKFFKNPKDPANYFTFYFVLSTAFGDDFLLQASLAFDEKVHPDQWSLLKMFGKDYLEERFKCGSPKPANDLTSLKNYLLFAGDKYESLFLRALNRIIQERDLNLELIDAPVPSVFPCITDWEKFDRESKVTLRINPTDGKTVMDVKLQDQSIFSYKFRFKETKTSGE